MALIPLYLDLMTKDLVSGLFNSAPYRLPPLRQEDTLTFDLTVVRKLSTLPLGNSPLFERVSMGGWTSLISVGVAAGTAIVSGTATGLSSDNFTFQNISLPLVGAGISALTEGQEIYFEVKLTETATGNFFGARYTTNLVKAISLAGSVVTPFADRALSLAEAQLGYVQYKLPAGRGIEFTSADGTKTGILYLDNDGRFNLPGPAL